MNEEKKYKRNALNKVTRETRATVVSYVKYLLILITLSNSYVYCQDEYGFLNNIDFKAIKINKIDTFNGKCYIETRFKIQPDVFISCRIIPSENIESTEYENIYILLKYSDYNRVKYYNQNDYNLFMPDYKYLNYYNLISFFNSKKEIDKRYLNLKFYLHYYSEANMKFTYYDLGLLDILVPILIPKDSITEKNKYPYTKIKKCRVRLIIDFLGFKSGF